MVDIDEMLPGRGTKGVIFIIRQLQEKHFAKEKHLYIAFVDLKKEFDCVSREMLWWAMRCLGIPEWLVSTSQAFHCKFN